MEASGKRYEYDGSNLPLDILRDILTRLSVQTLLKFKCVCKTWFCLISSSQFSKSHLNFSRNSKTYANHTVILTELKTSPYDRNAAFTCTLSCMLDGTPSIVNLKDFYYPFTKHGWIYGNCNGLLLLADGILDSSNPLGGDQILSRSNPALYNAGTRKMKRLPDSGTDTSNKEGDSRCVTYGLCYVELDDDYRVVELHTFQDHNENYVNELKIYSLRTNSWRKILGQTTNHSYFTSPGISVGGVLHWHSWFNSRNLSHILAVDTMTYTYRTLTCPKYDNTIFGSYILEGVMDFGGCLGVYHYYNETRIDIWTMKESWTKVLSVPYCDHPRGNTWPRIGLKDGQILLRNELGYWVVYNSKDHSFINHVIPNLMVPKSIPSPIYIESLVSPTSDGEQQLVSFCIE